MLDVRRGCEREVRMSKGNTDEDPDAWRQRIYAMLEREKMIVVKGKWRVPEMVG